MTRKKILNMLLAALLQFACLLPSSTETSAAKKRILEIDRNDVIPDTSIDSDDMILESGKQFYIGDMVSVRIDEKFDPFIKMVYPLDYYSATELGAT